ncbi:MAG: hypothetical protein WCI43_05490, partial [Candidatus Firestonebacteria bacterium]
TREISSDNDSLIFPMITQTTVLNPSFYEWFMCHGPEPELLRMVHGFLKAITREISSDNDSLIFPMITQISKRDYTD